MLPDFSNEKRYWQQGYGVIGIDEVGRGCLAGPLVMSAFVLHPKFDADVSELETCGINDSKKLSEKKREHLSSFLKQKYVSFSEMLDVSQINECGIMGAWRSGVGRLYTKVQNSYPDKQFVLLVDGSPVKDIPCKNDVEIVPLIKGDTKSISVAAASIIAKVTRDLYMKRLAACHPEYVWDQNKGYGTEAHRAAIKKYGITPWHRTLFVRSIL